MSYWRNHLRHCRLVVMVCALGCSLVACAAAKLIYSQMPRIAAAKLDDAFDLTQGQKRLVRSELDRMLLWHRRDQIPRIIDWLGRVEARMESDNGFSKEEVLDLADSLWVFRDAIYDYVYANSATFLSSMSAVQIGGFLKKQEESNKERFADLDKGGSAYSAIKAESWRKRLEDWFGDLTREQRSSVDRAASKAYEEDLRGRDEVLRSQRAFAEFLANLSTMENEELAAALWKLTPQSRGTPRFERGLGLVVDVATTLTSEQKQHFAEEVAVWRGRLQDVVLVNGAP